MTTELPRVYEPKSVEPEIYERWTRAGSFHAEPDGRGDKYCIVIPPPNVTDRLHVGHALNNTLQDVLIRWRRMQQYNTLWMPGTDHAGIATQTVVEKRILTEEGKRRTDFPREEFVARIQRWKDDYEATILGQLRLMGCSCDWRRTRFTMDEVCAKAVRAAFFKLFADGLIYRGKRLVNWDPATQTVLADDEVEHEQVQGHFWYLKYPLVEPVAFDRVAGSGMGVPPMRAEGSGMGVSPSEDQGIRKRQGPYLPHWTRTGGTYAVTFRLADSLPAEVVEAWRREREDVVRRARSQGRELTSHERRELNRLYSARVDNLLDSAQGSCWMRDERVGRIVHEALLCFQAERYDLIAWCVMPNHVHVVVRPRDGHELPAILHSWKSYTAKQANTVLSREGTFWQDEYYDHLIRDEEDFHNQVNYVLGNPAKAGLHDWPWVGMGRTDASDPAQDAPETQGQDAPATHGQDGHATHGQDAPATHGQDGHATHGQDGHATAYVTVATTRPETMLGDTAVAINPRDPRAPHLVGKRVRLPIVGRIVPIIADEHVVLPDPNSDDEKARFSTGFLKVTPGHDPDDYAIGQRHDLPVVNVLAPDGTISDKHGWTDWERVSKNPDGSPNADLQALIGLDRFEARQAVVELFRQEGLLEDVRPYTHQVGHSYRSHVPIEPYLSDQWYIAVKRPIADCGLRQAQAALSSSKGGLQIADWGKQHPELVEERDAVTYLKGTDVPVNSLAGLALAPLLDGRLRFVPDRYAKTYQTWLENLRDWPISRQLWWGHRIPVWRAKVFGGQAEAFAKLKVRLEEWRKQGRLATSGRVRFGFGHEDLQEDYPISFICVADPEDDEVVKDIERWEFSRDPDVLDTWFSSSLWPFSTLGWPEDTPELKTFYPGDVLCTAREIITLWVSRMVMMGQYCCGDIPFSDVFIHAMIQDGEGRKMSKSLGNGIDPLDIIDSHGADAMRFTLVSMTTQTQDVRMPVVPMRLPDGRCVNSSPKFDIGRNFCNKLWNASRFAMMNLRACPPWSDVRPHANLADRWILSRLSATIRDATAALEGYRFNELADTLYHFLWDDFCDWYLEVAKSRIQAGEATPKAILAYGLDVTLRLLHPVLPFITEAIWGKLNQAVPVRGPGGEPAEPLLVRARWPMADAAAIDLAAERDFGLLQELVRQVRNARTQHNVPPGKRVRAVADAGAAERAVVMALADNVELLKSQAMLEEVRLAEGLPAPPADAAAVTVAGVKLYVLGIIDRPAELARLTKQRDTLTRGVAGLQAKLDNQKFLANAPAEIVQRERERLEGLKADLASVQRSLDALSG